MELNVVMLGVDRYIELCVLMEVVERAADLGMDVVLVDRDVPELMCSFELECFRDIVREDHLPPKSERPWPKFIRKL